MNLPMKAVLGFVAVVGTPVALLWMRSAALPYTVVHIHEDRITLRDTLTLADATYPVARDASIVRDGRPAALGELRIGDRVAVELAELDCGRPCVTVLAAESTAPRLAKSDRTKL